MNRRQFLRHRGCRRGQPQRDDEDFEVGHRLLPVCHGDFDMAAYLKKLYAAGCHGPAGLQCFSVAGDMTENLKASIAEWKRNRGKSRTHGGKDFQSKLTL